VDRRPTGGVWYKLPVMLIRLEDVRVRLRERAAEPVTVLDVARLELPAGEPLCVVGRSGCGKTTLLNTLAGIVVPTDGRVRFGDTDIVRLSEARRDRFRAEHIGYVFQSFNLLQGLSAHENVALAHRFAGGSRAEASARADQLLERMELSRRRHALPAALSAGEQQRVAIARAVVSRPQLLLADEPTANLDARSSRAVLTLLEEVAAEQQSTLLVVTHDPRVRRRYQRVMSMSEGSLTDYEPAEDDA